VIHGERESSYATADEPLEQYVTFWQRPHLFKLEPVGSSTSDLLQTTHTRGSTAAFTESAIVIFCQTFLVWEEDAALPELVRGYQESTQLSGAYATRQTS
jgi:hypothetical protein